MIPIPGSMDGQKAVDKPHCGGGACAVLQPSGDAVGRLGTLDAVAPELPTK
jgi:hypothetical protein